MVCPMAANKAADKIILERPDVCAGTLLVVSILLCDDGVRVNTPDHTERTAGQQPHSVSVCVCVYVTAGSSPEQEGELSVLLRPPPPSRLTAGWDFEEFIMKSFEETAQVVRSSLAAAYFSGSARRGVRALCEPSK